MSATDRAAAPPELPKLRHVRPLGGGGYADVHLYEQDFPRLQVAVKVLRDPTAGGDHRFKDEADRMAGLSSHPNIVSIHGASVALDGRPYLVMEYCSGSTLAEKCRGGQLSVRAVLRHAVSVAGAVESVHRAGFLHRDIKPANVLTTSFDVAMLTDFGISVRTADTAPSQGMSLAWAAPELLEDDGQADVRTEVWALGATVHTLLTGRSPFADPSGRTSEMVMMTRIRGHARPRTGRSDVPDSLERILDRAMQKSPMARYQTAREMAKAFQAVEAELGLPQTPVHLVVDGADPDGADDSDDGRTRIRPLLVVDPTDGRASTAPPAVRPRTPWHDERVPVLDGTDLSGTLQRPRTASDAGPDLSSSGLDAARRAWPAAALVAGGAIVLALISGGVLVERHLHDAVKRDASSAADPAAPSEQDATIATVPAPTGVVVTIGADGAATASWSPPAGLPDGATYLWAVHDPAAATPLVQATPVAVSPVVIPRDVVAQAGARLCVEVATTLPNGRFSDPPAVGCT